MLQTNQYFDGAVVSIALQTETLARHRGRDAAG